MTIILKIKYLFYFLQDVIKFEYFKVEMLVESQHKSISP